MRVLVTGARGKVGRYATAALQAAGHEVTTTDLASPVYERQEPDEPDYVQADLTDAGAAYAVVAGHDAVVHAAAIPDPLHHAPHVVFRNNVLSGFNVVEACDLLGVRRLVNISSETVPGVVFAGGDVLPAYLPMDEETPARARDPYGFGKETIERWCDRVTDRSATLSAVSIRPSWVMHPGNYARNLGPVVADPYAPSLNFWAYTDATDLGEAVRLACEVDLEGHEVVFAAQPDNSAGRPLRELVERAFPDARFELRDLDRDDASGLDSGKAQRLLGWRPTASWRDHLDATGAPRS